MFRQKFATLAEFITHCYQNRGLNLQLLHHILYEGDHEMLDECVRILLRTGRHDPSRLHAAAGVLSGGGGALQKQPVTISTTTTKDVNNNNTTSQALISTTTTTTTSQQDYVPAEYPYQDDAFRQFLGINCGYQPATPQYPLVLFFQQSNPLIMETMFLLRSNHIETEEQFNLLLHNAPVRKLQRELLLQPTHYSRNMQDLFLFAEMMCQILSCPHDSITNWIRLDPVLSGKSDISTFYSEFPQYQDSVSLSQARFKTITALWSLPHPRLLSLLLANRGEGLVSKAQTLLFLEKKHISYLITSLIALEQSLARVLDKIHLNTPYDPDERIVTSLECPELNIAQYVNPHFYHEPRAGYNNPLGGSFIDFVSYEHEVQYHQKMLLSHRQCLALIFHHFQWSDFTSGVQSAVLLTISRYPGLLDFLPWLPFVDMTPYEGQYNALFPHHNDPQNFDPNINPSPAAQHTIPLPTTPRFGAVLKNQTPQDLFEFLLLKFDKETCDAIHITHPNPFQDHALLAPFQQDFALALQDNRRSVVSVINKEIFGDDVVVVAPEFQHAITTDPKLAQLPLALSRGTRSVLDEVDVLDQSLNNSTVLLIATTKTGGEGTQQEKNNDKDKKELTSPNPNDSSIEQPDETQDKTAVDEAAIPTVNIHDQQQSPTTTTTTSNENKDEATTTTTTTTTSSSSSSSIPNAIATTPVQDAADPHREDNNIEMGSQLAPLASAHSADHPEESPDAATSTAAPSSTTAPPSTTPSLLSCLPRSQSDRKPQRRVQFVDEVYKTSDSRPLSGSPNQDLYREEAQKESILSRHRKALLTAMLVYAVQTNTVELLDEISETLALHSMPSNLNEIMSSNVKKVNFGNSYNGAPREKEAELSTNLLNYAQNYQDNLLAIAAATPHTTSYTLKSLLLRKSKLCTNNKSNRENNAFYCVYRSQMCWFLPRNRYAKLLVLWRFVKDNERTYKPHIDYHDFVEATLQHLVNNSLSYYLFIFVIENVINATERTEFRHNALRMCEVMSFLYYHSSYQSSTTPHLLAHLNGDPYSFAQGNGWTVIKQFTHLPSTMTIQSLGSARIKTLPHLNMTKSHCHFPGYHKDVQSIPQQQQQQITPKMISYSTIPPIEMSLRDAYDLYTSQQRLLFLQYFINKTSVLLFLPPNEDTLIFDEFPHMLFQADQETPAVPFDEYDLTPLHVPFGKNISTNNNNNNNITIVDENNQNENNANDGNDQDKNKKMNPENDEITTNNTSNNTTTNKDTPEDNNKQQKEDDNTKKDNTTTKSLNNNNKRGTKKLPEHFIMWSRAYQSLQALNNKILKNVHILSPLTLHQTVTATPTHTNEDGVVVRDLTFVNVPLPPELDRNPSVSPQQQQQQQATSPTAAPAPTVSYKSTKTTLQQQQQQHQQQQQQQEDDVVILPKQFSAVLSQKRPFTLLLRHLYKRVFKKPEPPGVVDPHHPNDPTYQHQAGNSRPAQRDHLQTLIYPLIENKDAMALRYLLDLGVTPKHMWQRLLAVSHMFTDVRDIVDYIPTDLATAPHKYQVDGLCTSNLIKKQPWLRVGDDIKEMLANEAEKKKNNNAITTSSSSTTDQDNVPDDVDYSDMPELIPDVNEYLKKLGESAKDALGYASKSQQKFAEEGVPVEVYQSQNRIPFLSYDFLTAQHTSPFLSLLQMFLLYDNSLFESSVTVGPRNLSSTALIANFWPIVQALYITNTDTFVPTGEFGAFCHCKYIYRPENVPTFPGVEEGPWHAPPAPTTEDEHIAQKKRRGLREEFLYDHDNTHYLKHDLLGILTKGMKAKTPNMSEDAVQAKLKELLPYRTYHKLHDPVLTDLRTQPILNQHNVHDFTPSFHLDVLSCWMLMLLPKRTLNPLQEYYSMNLYEFVFLHFMRQMVHIGPAERKELLGYINRSFVFHSFIPSSDMQLFDGSIAKMIAIITDAQKEINVKQQRQREQMYTNSIRTLYRYQTILDLVTPQPEMLFLFTQIHRLHSSSLLSDLFYHYLKNGGNYTEIFPSPLELDIVMILGKVQPSITLQLLSILQYANKPYSTRLHPQLLESPGDQSDDE